MRKLLMAIGVSSIAWGAWALDDIRLGSIWDIRKATYYSLPDSSGSGLSSLALILKRPEGQEDAFSQGFVSVANDDLPQFFYIKNPTKISFWNRVNCQSVELYSFKDLKQLFLENYDPDKPYEPGFGRANSWQHRVVMYHDLKRGFLGDMLFKNIRVGSKFYPVIAGPEVNFDNLIDPDTKKIYDEIKTNRDIFPNQGQLERYYESEKFETSLLEKCDGFNIYQMEIVK